MRAHNCRRFKSRCPAIQNQSQNNSINLTLSNPFTKPPHNSFIMVSSSFSMCSFNMFQPCLAGVQRIKANFWRWWNLHFTSFYRQILLLNFVEFDYHFTYTKKDNKRITLPACQSFCGCSLVVKHQPSKLARWVRFPSPAFLRHGEERISGHQGIGLSGRDRGRKLSGICRADGIELPAV